MATVETQEQADLLNQTGEFGPYRAANGHLMVAPLRFPTDTEAYDAAVARAEGGEGRLPSRFEFERDFRVGDVIRYDSFAAECAPGCSHRDLGPLEDW